MEYNAGIPGEVGLELFRQKMILQERTGARYDIYARENYRNYEIILVKSGKSVETNEFGDYADEELYAEVEIDDVEENERGMSNLRC